MRLAQIALVLLFSIAATVVLGGEIEDLAKRVDDLAKAIKKDQLRVNEMKQPASKIRRETILKEKKKELEEMQKELHRLARKEARSNPLPIDTSESPQTQMDQLHQKITATKKMIESQNATIANYYKSNDRIPLRVRLAHSRGKESAYRTYMHRLSQESGIPHRLSRSPSSSPEPAAKRARYSQSHEGTSPHFKPPPPPSFPPQWETQFPADPRSSRSFPPSASFGYQPPTGFNEPQSHQSQESFSPLTQTPPSYPGASSSFGTIPPPGFNQHQHSERPPPTPFTPYAPTYQLPPGPFVHQYGAPPTGSTTSHRTFGQATAPQPSFPTGGTFQPQPPSQLGLNQPPPPSHAFSPPPGYHGGQTNPSFAQYPGVDPSSAFGYPSSSLGQSSGSFGHPSAPQTGVRRTAGEGRAGTTATAHPFAPPGSPDLGDLFRDDEHAKKYR